MIQAKVIAHSIANDIPIVTLQLKYPRMIHEEFMTHRVFSRNASSSRAIPVAKMLDRVREEHATPIHWGRNQPGMQAEAELEGMEKEAAQGLWHTAAMSAASYAEGMTELNVHKQIANRLTEPFQHINVIVTATEWDNFFKLRDHKAAQPEIRELAQRIREAISNSNPNELKYGEWHLPYLISSDKELNINDARLVSAARCARVSYVNHDNSDPDTYKDIALARRLIASGHFSPTEHQATPMEYVSGALYDRKEWENGITHMDKYANLWSGNFKGWIQYRQLL